jgi:phosphoribosyl 1,2-cyclic phosphodiesterase
MVRFTVLASGSKGNSSVITTGQTSILVDCGLSCRETFRRMRLAGEEPEKLSAIVITHEHQDHVGGVAVTARKLKIPVYFTEGTHRAWMRWLSPRRQMTYAQWIELCGKQAAERAAEAATDNSEPDENDLADGSENNGSIAAADSAPADPPERREPTWLPAVEYFQAGQPFEIGNIAFSPFTTSHDAVDPVGFVFTAEGIRMGYATDLGYISPNIRDQLKNLNLLLLESNHDLEMLRDGPYPWAVKQRVLSRVGHLSNEAASKFLEEDYDGKAAYVILAHLSEINNLPDLARLAAERALNGRPSLLTNHLLLAEQSAPLSPIYF